MFFPYCTVRYDDSIQNRARCRRGIFSVGPVITISISGFVSAVWYYVGRPCGSDSRSAGPDDDELQWNYQSLHACCLATDHRFTRAADAVIYHDEVESAVEGPYQGRDADNALHPVYTTDNVSPTAVHACLTYLLASSPYDIIYVWSKAKRRPQNLPLF